MPPPVSPQGSRAGLITAVVVFTVLFVTATIFAIYFGVERDKLQLQLDTTNSKFKTIAVDVNGPEVQELVSNARTNPNIREKTALAQSIDQTKQLVKVIMGTVPTTQPTIAALSAASKSIEDTRTTLGTIPPAINSNDPLITDLPALAVNVVDLKKQLDDAATAATTAAADAARQIKEAQDALAAKAAVVDAANAAAQAAKDAQAAEHQRSEDKIAQNTADIEKERAAFKDAQQKMEVARAEQDRVMDSLKKELDRTRLKLAARRPNTMNPIVQQPDGQILRVGPSDTVYINLGRTDQIQQGLTFEVYDKHDGIPPLGDGLSNEDLPIGVASIEVTQVGATNSLCRVVKTTLGQQITEGDPIVNLIYDRNTQYNVVVYGSFDMQGDGIATPQDADVIKRLVTQWGGHLQNTVNADTDFVVVGKEPELPNFSADELANDRFKQQKMDDAKKAVEAYAEVIQAAKDRYIPIMNQNRFLYFTGYFDLARR